VDADVVVIGAGQAGLAMGRAVRRHGLGVVLLDAAPRLGESWRIRWDSLRLFTPGTYSALSGLRMPGPRDRHPGKDDVADYLIRYAGHFELQVLLNSRVTDVVASPVGPGFEVRTSTGSTLHTGQVVVATGPFQQPVRPPFAADLDERVVQLHSHDYRNPGGLPASGVVLVVGRGNSGAQIAAELAAAGRQVVVSGRRQPYLPNRILGRDVFWWLHRLNLLHAPTTSWRGRLLRRRGEPVIGTDLGALATAGSLRLVPRATGVTGSSVCFQDGQRVEPSVVVWATGYRGDYAWLRLPVLDDTGQPQHHRGMTAMPGLYFIGLPWQSQRGSALLDGVDRDAARLARRIVTRAGAMGRTVS
jgi:putative flavoprotein involved in K+ transport